MLDLKIVERKNNKKYLFEKERFFYSLIKTFNDRLFQDLYKIIYLFTKTKEKKKEEILNFIFENRDIFETNNLYYIEKQLYRLGHSDKVYFYYDEFELIKKKIPIILNYIDNNTNERYQNLYLKFLNFLKNNKIDSKYRIVNEKFIKETKNQYISFNPYFILSFIYFITDSKNYEEFTSSIEKDLVKMKLKSLKHKDNEIFNETITVYDFKLEVSMDYINKFYFYKHSCCNIKGYDSKFNSVFLKIYNFELKSFPLLRVGRKIKIKQANNNYGFNTINFKTNENDGIINNCYYIDDFNNNVII